MGIDQVLALINLDEDPCVLIDTQNEYIVYLNSQFVKMTSYFNADLKEKPAAALFPNLALSTVTSGEIRDVEINRKEQSLIKVPVKFDFIDSNAHWMIVRIQNNINRELQDQQYEKIFSQLTDFSNTSEGLNSEEEFFRIIDLVQLMLNVDSACLYQADPTFPTLRRTCVVGKKADFPQELPSSDLVRLVDPVKWEPGNRVFTELHRFARINELEYIASAPLKQDDAVIGVLVVAGRNKIPSEFRMSVLQYLAFQICNTIQKMTLTKNLVEKVTSLKEIIEHRNVTIENMHEGLIMLHPNLTISGINPAAEWMLGYAESEVKDQPYDNILIGTDRLLPALEDAKKGNTTHNVGKVTLNRRSGQSFPVQMMVIPVINLDKLLGIEILISDISEHEQSKALTQQLEHRAVLGDYTAAFAHDVRNPINNISTGIQLLGVRLDPDDPNQEIINRAQNDCTRLVHLMESFLAFSRFIELKYEPIDLKIYLQRIIDRWRPRFAKENVTPAVHIDPDVPLIMGDPRSLDQVFTNLISNAVEAMTDVGDTLAIRVVMNNDISGHPNVDISVSDNGPGIPEDIKEHIFEPFISTRQKGTGLGLAITKQIVTAHKGSISVNSFPGGTVFTVRIPVDDGE